MTAVPPVLSLQKTSKSFGSVRALHEVDLDLNAGEVVGLMGDNGAGKSTLLKIVGGLLHRDGGRILLDGKAVELPAPHVAQEHGIAVVHQDLALCDNLTAGENIFLGREPVRSFGPLTVVDFQAMHKAAAEMFAELGSATPSESLVKNLSGGQRQATAIARVLIGDAKVILMDEPTAAISLKQVEEVLALIRRLKAQGKAIIIASHRMGDIFAVADRIVVLWRGEKAADKPRGATTPDEIASFITGANRIAA
ncbi:MAG: ATP-binding cassette domain-containing protein [Alphaproteobacteria bacterium]|nr:ATP-binding cassette domain-containing protein [Alphaproteobacteria bacterium]